MAGSVVVPRLYEESLLPLDMCLGTTPQAQSAVHVARLPLLAPVQPGVDDMPATVSHGTGAYLHDTGMFRELLINGYRAKMCRRGYF